MVCTIKTISLQLNPLDQWVLAKESSKDSVIARVMCYTPPKLRSEGDSSVDCSVEAFWKLAVSLSTILHDSRVVIPPSPEVLQLWLAQLYTGHRSTLILWISAITA